MLEFNLPFISLPNSFVQLLKTHFKGTSSRNENKPIIALTVHDKAFKFIVKNTLKEYAENRSIESTLDMVGWKYLRERLANVYLNNINSGQYNFSFESEEIEDVLEFEEKFVTVTFDSLSRVFLLGFYLSVYSLKNKGKVIVDTSDNFNLTKKSRLLPFEDDVYKILKTGRVKHERVDYIILTLSVLRKYYSVEDLISFFSTNSKNFYQIIAQLPLDQQKLVFNNLLSYTISIHDYDMLFYERV